MSAHRFVIVDVFTERPLAGNQLAVFPDAHDVPESLLLPLAQEIGYSETVYVYPEPGATAVPIRIFTPGGEIPFAGHPVLGTAALLGLERQAREIVLGTRRGEVPVALTLEGEHRASGWMRQPLPTVSLFEDPRLLPALGVERSQLPVEIYELGIRHLFVALASEAEVAALRPDLGRLRELGLVGINCFAGSGRRWKTRMFGPAHGVDEDPATGSAAGPLVTHLCRHGRVAWGETIEISQGVEIGRPSKLLARAAGPASEPAAGPTRVEVGGTAIVVGRGEFRADLG